jgi:cytosine deaminase
LTTPLTATLIRNVALPYGRGDLAVMDDRLIPAAAVARATEIDGSGLAAIPRLTDSHVHLDKALLGRYWRPHASGQSIAERIALEKAALRDPTLESTYVRACRLVELAVSHGSTRLRSHVDISAELGLTRLEALLAVRETYRDVVDITFVAFPQDGILSSPGTAELLDEALSRGVEAIGGLDPASRDGDIDGHLDIVFGLAARHASDVDIHLHDPGTLGTYTMRAIADRTVSLGLQGRVAISHGYALGMVDRPELDRTARALADASVALITNVPGGHHRPPPEVLSQLGVNVVLASDNVRDSWSPYGKADMLERVALAGYLFSWNEDARLLAGLTHVTSAPSKLLGDPLALLRPGDPADFTLVRASSVQEAIVVQPQERTVYRRGRVVADNGTVFLSTLIGSVAP